MTNSTHQVLVAPIQLHTHPNADRLEVATIFAYRCVVQKGLYKDGDLVAYIPPDSVVDTERPEFAFLGVHNRIKAKKIRGVWSMGLILPSPPGSVEGQDVAEILGVTHYEPPEIGFNGKNLRRANSIAVPGMLNNLSKYDVDSLRRYPDFLEEGEPCWMVEKIHGANARLTFYQGKIYVGTRNRWVDPADEQCPWWNTLRANSDLGAFLLKNPDILFYGELFGDIQNMKYGCKPGERHFAFFDAFDLNSGGFLDLFQAWNLPAADTVTWAPCLYQGPYSFTKAEEHAEGTTTLIGSHHREGCVIRPLKETLDYRGNRKIMKLVSNTYLEKN